MKLIKSSFMGLFMALTAASFLVACDSGKNTGGVRAETGTSGAVAQVTRAEAPKRKTVTFIELGSVNCVPCKAMQPLMDELRAKYPDQVEVVFYDVWTAEGRPYGSAFGIRVIPTQVFLDAEGKEYFRHEGFFPMEELVQVLAKGGVKR
jgi:thioredoxin 1